MQLNTAVKVSVGLIVFLCLCTEVIIGTEVCSSNGDIRLFGGPNEFEGRLEYCLNSQWGHVCGSEFDKTDGIVACRQLGYSTSFPIVLSINVQKYGAEEGLAHLNFVQCNGNEMRLGDCMSQNVTNQTGCSEYTYTYLFCKDPSCTASADAVGSIRLFGGSSPMVGRVEVCSRSGFRVEVCDNNWDNNDARVVCRQLGWLQNDNDAMAITGYQVATVRFSAYSNVDCTGDELYLTNCSSRLTTQFFTCTYAGVNCSGVGMSSVLPVRSTMTNLLVSSSPTLSLVEMITRPVASSMFALLSSPVASTTLISPSSPIPSESPTSISSNQNNTTLLAAVIGTVGGLIVLLLVLLLIMLVVFLARRQQTLQKYNVPQHINSVNVPGMELKNSDIQPTKGDQMPRNESVPDADHVLSNPMYNLNPNIFGDENEYAEINSEVGKKSPSLNPKQFQGALHGYSVPIDDLNGSDVSPDDHLYHSLKSPSRLQAAVDKHGYSGVNTHLYDDLHDNTLSSQLEVRQSVSPYETPVVLPYETIDLIKRVEAYAEENRTEGWNEAEPTLVDSNQSDQHEYKTLEESIEPHAYENALVMLNEQSLEEGKVPVYENVESPQ